MIATDSVNAEHRVRAVSAIERGGQFPIVWVQFTDGGDRIPWPVESVRPE